MANKSSKMTCKHRETVAGNDRPFAGSVAAPGHENPAAHGNISYEETCSRCGATRRLNLNQRHVEYGPWHARALLAAR